MSISWFRMSIICIFLSQNQPGSHIFAESQLRVQMKLLHKLRKAMHVDNRFPTCNGPPKILHRTWSWLVNYFRWSYAGITTLNGYHPPPWLTPGATDFFLQNIRTGGQPFSAKLPLPGRKNETKSPPQGIICLVRMLRYQWKRNVIYKSSFFPNFPTLFVWQFSFTARISIPKYLYNS